MDAEAAEYKEEDDRLVAEGEDSETQGEALREESAAGQRIPHTDKQKSSGMVANDVDRGQTAQGVQDVEPTCPHAVRALDARGDGIITRDG
jgi:hypothetical protein